MLREHQQKKGPNIVYCVKKKMKKKSDPQAKFACLASTFKLSRIRYAGRKYQPTPLKIAGYAGQPNESDPFYHFYLNIG